MSRWLTRTISATLVAVFAILASAAALCLVPCELTPSVPPAEAAAAEAHHCSQAPASVPGVTAMNGIEDSCADQHAWAAPAVDRTAPRASAAGVTSETIAVVAVQFHAERSTLDGPRATPPDSPPLTSTPLRI